MHCHKLIAHTAKEIAGNLYEDMARDNNWYNGAKDVGIDQREFISQVWPQLIEEARHTLTRLLTTPIAESLKEVISDALIKDNMLREGRLKSTFRVH